jgi:2-iminoacetate synthase
MRTFLESPHESLTRWVRETDVHAGYRVPLLERARTILSGQASADPDEYLDLAVRLERWRYQHLNERAAEFVRQDRRLVDALDLAANELTGGKPRPPRSPRAAINDSSYDPVVMDKAIACLDPAIPLDEVAALARDVTMEHFSHPAVVDGKATVRRRMLLYAPLYLSSFCINHCMYCGFRFPHQVERKHLDLEEALREADVLAGCGFVHLLLVAGDFPKLLTTAYYVQMLNGLCAIGIQPAVEIAPQSTASYTELVGAGACGVTLYQETYQEALYARYHPRGSKASYDWRLEGLERAAEAGMGRLGLGILVGLGEPEGDLRAMMRHAVYLQSRFPDRTMAFSLPRIHEAPDGFEPPYRVDDENFIRMYCALRVAFPRAELVLSTRESAALRNRLAQICITQMSAGSCTSPGGYQDSSPNRRTGEQFPVCDQRSPAQVAEWLSKAGLEPAWDLFAVQR